ncbi:hypothetical protein ACHAPO_011282 [Fusarium lateritium]
MEASIYFTRRHGKDIDVDNAIVQFWAEGHTRDVQSASASDFEKPEKHWLTIDMMAIFTHEELIEVTLGDELKKFHASTVDNQIEAKVNKESDQNYFLSYWYPLSTPLDSADNLSNIPSIRPGQSDIYLRDREKRFKKNKDKCGCLKMISMKITTTNDCE